MKIVYSPFYYFLVFFLWMRVCTDSQRHIFSLLTFFPPSCIHAHMQTMTILPSNSNSIPPSPSPFLPLPLYLRFVLSYQTHLSSHLSTQQQQENIILLDHGFQLALFLHHDNSYISSNSNDKDDDNNYRHSDNGVNNSTPLSSQNSTVVDSDLTMTSLVTTTTTTPTATHTFLHSTKKLHGQCSKERIDNNTEDMFPDFYLHSVASTATTTTSHRKSDNIMTERDIEGNKPTVLEMTLTIGHQDDDDEEVEYSKEYYAAMTHAIHLFEIDLNGDRLYMSKAIDGHDLIRRGVSCKASTTLSYNAFSNMFNNTMITNQHPNQRDAEYS